MEFSKIGHQDLITILKTRLPAALGSASMPATAGWSLGEVRSAALFGLPVVSLTLARGDLSFEFHLLPSNSHETRHYPDEHVDAIFVDNTRETRVDALHNAVDQLVGWLGTTLKPGARQLALITPVVPLQASSDPTQFELLTALESSLARALFEGTIPGLEGWSLDSVGLECFRGKLAPTLRMSLGAEKLVIHLPQTGSDTEAYLRTSRFDVFYDDDEASNRFTSNHAKLEHFTAWLAKAFPSAEDARERESARRKALQTLKAQVNPAQASLVEEIKHKFHTAQRSGELMLPEGWSLEGAAVEWVQGAPNPTVRLRHEENTFAFRLVATDPAREPYLRTPRFDVLFEEHTEVSTRDQPAIDRFSNWLGKTFSATKTAQRPPRRTTPRAPDASELTVDEVAADIDAALTLALQNRELTQLIGWTLDAVEVAPFRGHSAPVVRFSRDNETLDLHLLPTGSDPEAGFRTDRFDVLYDDDEASIRFARNHAVIEGFTAWLTLAFPVGEEARQREIARRRALLAQKVQVDPALAAVAEEVKRKLQTALQSGELQMPEGWAFDDVIVEQQQSGSGPAVHFLNAGKTFTFRLLATDPNREAYLRTSRFDVLYDDDDEASRFTRNHALIESFTAWLILAFPVGEEARQQELARRRALLAQKVQVDPALAAIAEEVKRKLQTALQSEELQMPEGWTFDDVIVEQQQSGSGPAVHFLNAGRTFTFRLLATDPNREAHLRTSRFDVLYDSVQGDSQQQDEPLARTFMAWLEATFSPPPEAVQAPSLAPTEDASGTPRKTTNVTDPALPALAHEIDQALSSALGTSALPNAEAWSLKHVAVQEFQGTNAVEVMFLLRERSLVFYVAPTNTENRAYRRTSRFDLLYADDAQGGHFARDKVMIDEFSSWFSTWDAPAPGPAAEPAPS